MILLAGLSFSLGIILHSCYFQNGGQTQGQHPGREEHELGEVSARYPQQKEEERRGRPYAAREFL